MTAKLTLMIDEKSLSLPYLYDFFWTIVCVLYYSKLRNANIKKIIWKKFCKFVHKLNCKNV